MIPDPEAPSSRTMPKDIQGILFWIAEHDGRIDAWWGQQHRWNHEFEKRVRQDMTVLSDRVSAVEKRVVFASGVAAAVGAIFGALLTAWLGVGGVG